jgi:Flp pilus assembly protein TadD
LSLLLKALKQAETAHAQKPEAGKGQNDLELEPLAGTASAQGREWVEPPGLLFGSSGLSPQSHPRPAFRMPQVSLVPLTAALAALVALGYGVYLYLALQPPAAVPLPEPGDAVAPPAAASAATPESAGDAMPATPPAAPAPAAPAPAAPAPAAPAPAAPAPAAPPPAAAPDALPPRGAPPVPRIARAARTSPEAAAVAVAPPVFQPDPQAALLNQAYAAYQRGALDEAQRLYADAAARHRNVDALLGLAAIASMQGREADAQRLYREVLDLDPRSAAAQGALLDLLGSTDSQAAESRLKALIEREPSPQLYQTLGNLHADQGRWSEAQAAYFESWRGAPDNADYAFNLAVSLDQLRQYPAALTYYEKALALGNAHRFDRARAEARIQQLKSAR